MKNVALHIDYNTGPEKLAGVLKEYNLQQGDKLTVTTQLDEELTLLIVIVVLIALHEKLDYPNKVIEDIFSSKSSKDIRNEIAREYGIEVKVETKKTIEEDSWLQFSKEKLSKAYGTDEPEYDLSMVQEPNPDYKK